MRHLLTAWLAGLALLAAHGAAMAEPQSARIRGFTPPPSLAALARPLSAAVVAITTTVKRRARSGATTPRDEFHKFFRRRKETPRRRPAPRRRPTALGSGFIISADGYVITNNHVIANADAIHVVLRDGTRLKATLRGRDPKTDLAVLKVSSDKPLPYVAFGDSDAMRVGDWVLAIGNPFGLGGTVTLGIISARNRDISAGPYDSFIQTDAAINKGNSGGPLFNMKGEVVGVNSAILSPSGGSVGIGFAIPANLAKTVVAQLIKYGETRRGWLGVKIQTLSEDMAQALGLKRAEGALVAEVTPGGPAGKAGLKPRDVILSFDGRAITRMRDLPRIVAETPVGKRVVVEVMRDGRRLALNVELGRLEDGEKMMRARAGSAAGPGDGKDKAADEAGHRVLLGMTLRPVDDRSRARFKLPAKIGKGLLVMQVAAESQAAEKGIVEGDVIVEVGGKEVATPEQAAAQIAAFRARGRKAVPLLVLSRAMRYEPRFIALRLPAKTPAK